jgi:hypothetical protein
VRLTDLNEQEGGGRGEQRQEDEAYQQEREVEKRRGERDRLLAAIHHLEARLASAVPGREQEWTSQVRDALSDLQCVLSERLDSEDELPDQIRKAGFGVTEFLGKGKNGDVELMCSVVLRRDVKDFMNLVA